MHGDRQPPVGERDPDRRPPELHRKREPVQPVGEPGGEVQNAVTDIAADVAALDEIERPRHHPEVDTLLGRTALDVSDVALEHLDQAIPRALRVQRGQDRGVRDETERRAVRGPRVVVGDVLAGGVGPVLVTEPFEQMPQLLIGEQVEEHDRVSLLSEHVSVLIVSLGA